MGLRLCLALCIAFAATLAAQDAPKAEPSIAELWATGCLWEVGDNRVTVPKARQALIDAGEPALAHALTRLVAKDTLETRCLSVVFGGWKANADLGPKALQGLVANIAHTDPTARRNVADLLDQFNDRSAADKLLAGARAETVEGVRMAQLAPLARWKFTEALPLLVEASRTRTERLRSRAAALLGHFEEAAALDRLIELAADSTYYVSDAATNTLRGASIAARARCLAELGLELAKPATELRAAFTRQMLGVVATLDHADTARRILDALAHENAGLRADAADALVIWKAGAGRLDSTLDVAGTLKAARAKETDPFAKTTLDRAIQRLSDSGNNG